jgi:molecular chaperone GrpE (heat shock protein)
MKSKREKFEDKIQLLRDTHGSNWKNVCHLDLGGSKAPDPNPGQIAAAESATEVGKMQKETAMEYLNFSKEQYQDFKDDLKEIAAAQKQIMSDSAKRAEEYATYERETFRPLEKRLVSEAESFDTAAKREEMASQGMADVAQAYESQRQQALDTLAKYGVNPNSARFAAINAQLAQGEAGARAGVATKSRIASEEMGRARLYDAAALGRGLASNATAAAGLATSAGTSAGATTLAPSEFMSKSYGQTGSMLGGAGSSFGTAGNIYGQEFNARMGAYNAEQQRRADAMSGFGKIAGSIIGGGFFADGGKVKRLGRVGKVNGPGGPVDDKIPAMLSDGEYVLPADTVKAIGVKKLDKMVKQTHTPASVQKRKALGKRSA